MNGNTKIHQLREKLADQGVFWKVLWSAKRHPGTKHDDVFFLSFHHKEEGYKPFISTGMLIDYSADKGGYGLYLEAPTNKIDDDVQMIAAGY